MIMKGYQLYKDYLLSSYSDLTFLFEIVRDLCFTTITNVSIIKMEEAIVQNNAQTINLTQNRVYHRETIPFIGRQLLAELSKTPYHDWFSSLN